MHKALRRALGILTAAGVVILARPAPAQTPSYPPRTKQTPVRTAFYQETVNHPEGRIRLEEMKVELALLSDSTTFPYYLGTRAAGTAVEVRGYVPNDTVKQRALELARRSTSVQVVDGLKIQNGLSLRPPQRGALVLQKEGEALLAKDLGETSRRVSVEAQPDGQVTLTGTIGSIEEKLAVSRLFRQLSGCSAVVNRLTVQPVLRDGQRIVLVTKNGSQAVPTAALGGGSEPVAASLAAPGATPGAPKSAPASPSISLASLNPELHLPSTGSAKSHTGRPGVTTGTISPITDSVLRPPITTGTISPEGDTVLQPVAVSKSVDAAPPGATLPKSNSSGSVDILTAPKPPASWSRPAIRWESESKAKPPVPSAAPPAPTARTVVAATQPLAVVPPATVPPPQAAPAWHAAAPPQKQMAAVPPPQKPAVPAAPPTLVASVAVPAAAKPSPAIVQEPTDSLPPLRSKRHWPPAYDVRPPEAEAARPGSMTFEEGPAAPSVAIGPPRSLIPPNPKPKVQQPATPRVEQSPTPRNVAAQQRHAMEPTVPRVEQPATPRIAVEPPRPIAPPPDWKQLDLKQKVLAVCGRQAREVIVERNADGSVRVKVKTPSFAAEQLTRKILTIPEMAGSNVSLMMELVP